MIEDKNGNTLKEDVEITNIQSEYCKDLCYHQLISITGFIDITIVTNREQNVVSVIREEVEEAICTLPAGQSTRPKQCTSRTLEII